MTNIKLTNVDQIMIKLSIINFFFHLGNLYDISQLVDNKEKTVHICIDGCVSINKINE